MNNVQNNLKGYRLNWYFKVDVAEFNFGENEKKKLLYVFFFLPSAFQWYR